MGNGGVVRGDSRSAPYCERLRVLTGVARTPVSPSIRIPSTWWNRKSADGKRRFHVGGNPSEYGDATCGKISSIPEEIQYRYDTKITS